MLGSVLLHILGFGLDNESFDYASFIHVFTVSKSCSKLKFIEFILGNFETNVKFYVTSFSSIAEHYLYLIIV
jgi:hypothetical protein